MRAARARPCRPASDRCMNQVWQRLFTTDRSWSTPSSGTGFLSRYAAASRGRPPPMAARATPIRRSTWASRIARSGADVGASHGGRARRPRDHPPRQLLTCCRMASRRPAGKSRSVPSCGRDTRHRPGLPWPAPSRPRRPPGPTCTMLLPLLTTTILDAADAAGRGVTRPRASAPGHRARARPRWLARSRRPHDG